MTNIVRQEVRSELIDRLAFMSLKPQIIAVLNEDDSAEIQKKYPEAKIEKATTLDAIIALPAQSVDLIFANIFLPFQPDWKHTILAWRRLLRPDGLLMFSSLGPDTLQNIHAEISCYLTDMHLIGDELMQVHFSNPVLDVEHLTLSYRDEKKLKDELVEMGFLSKTAELSVEPDEDGALCVNFEIVYGHAFSVSESVADEAGVVRVPLSHLRRKKE